MACAPCAKRAAELAALKATPAITNVRPRHTGPLVSLMVNTWNEGPRVQSTVTAFHDYFTANGITHEIIVLDDASTDGCCKDIKDARVIRVEQGIGCGKAKRMATATATGMNFMWVDAHQAPFAGDYKTALMACMERPLVICPVSVNMEYSPDWKPLRFGKAEFIPNIIGLTPKPVQYATSNPVGWDRKTTWMVPVGLMMSRETYERVGPWNAFHGCLGSQERGMAMRALMADTPIEVWNDLKLGHEYTNAPSRRNKLKVERHGFGSYSLNLWHSYYTVVGAETFAAYFKPWLTKAKPIPDKLFNEYAPMHQDHAHYMRFCKRVPDQKLIDILESQIQESELMPDTGGSGLEPEAIRIIASLAHGRCLELGTGTCIGTNALLTGATGVVTVDHIPKFATAAQTKYANDTRVSALLMPIGKDKFYDLTGIEGPFDTILLDGPPFKARTNAMAHLFPRLAPDGMILVDDAKRDAPLIAAWLAAYPLWVEQRTTHRGLAILRRKT